MGALGRDVGVAPALSPDGRTPVSGGDHQVRLWTFTAAYMRDPPSVECRKLYSHAATRRDRP
ncbi:gsr1349 [Gloeobacter violaceus PCC 7421]|uniref:Gsr1349 protein n=1 Tax=Gloeobacter violaceus (strain ATCC 29082 / PCC 7421) TaxID=251221 RepID=Q7NKX7_GLOVI|nr:gsr1349 [Gloeobacter violaceus PCC 7421]